MNYILGINFRFAVHTVMLVDSQISIILFRYLKQFYIIFYQSPTVISNMRQYWQFCVRSSVYIYVLRKILKLFENVILTSSAIKETCRRY
jgi:hypothetical protein